MLALNGSQQTMSSLEIAKLTGKDHKHVLADIRKTLEEANIQTAGFSAVYKSIQNKDLPCYNLPRRECDLVVSGYSVPYRLAIIDRWHELEEVISYPEALRRLADSIEITQLAIENQKIAEAKANILRIELDKSKDFATIKKVAEHNGISWKTIEWRELKEENIKITGCQNKIFDANFPAGVNTYHRDAWVLVYPDLEFPD
jgi:phage regulator Rha-like protein